MDNKYNYKIIYHKRTKKHPQNLKAAKLERVAKELIELLKDNPLKSPPIWKALSGDLKGFYSRRINDKHRLVYSIDEENKNVTIYSMWTHYEF